MNLIEMDGFLRGKCIPGDMLVNESNAEYLVRKFQELSAQRDALERELCMSEAKCKGYFSDAAAESLKCLSLAAESAGLKSAFEKPDAWLSWHSIPPTFYEPDRGGEYLQVHEQAGEKNDDGSDSWPVYRNPETETPATDAFLAEVRAQGVDAAIDHLHKKFEGTGHIGVPVMALEWLAAKLRQGAAL